MIIYNFIVKVIFKKKMFKNFLQIDANFEIDTEPNFRSWTLIA